MDLRILNQNLKGCISLPNMYVESKSNAHKLKYIIVKAYGYRLDLLFYNQTNCFRG